ncbi:MAG: DUF2300 domain-containing protein [Magnetococcales bacterium]|nr:DUF2300 domain-containing protein [Magnetococcales bacterium]
MRPPWKAIGMGLSLWWCQVDVAWAGCAHAFDLEAWMAQRAGAWWRRLAPLAGAEPPGGIEICRIPAGRPHARGGRIVLPPLREEEARLSVAHEYVHLVFRHHPRTRDERFVEQMARELILGEQ